MPGWTVQEGGSSGLTITLPPVATSGPVVVSPVDAGSGTLTVTTNDSSTINGGASYEVSSLAVTLYSDGAAWHTIGGGPNFFAITTTTTLVAGGFYLDSPGGAHTLSLPTPVLAGQQVKVKNITGASTVTIKSTDGSTIDGITGTTGIPLAAALDTVQLVTDGTNWWRVA